jgi:hypothetical protein
MYLNPDEYTGKIPADELEERLKRACQDIDTLTYNKIVKAGFENLTQFQQNIIKDAVERHADFCYENAEMLDSMLSGYSINGVSMSFDKSKIVTVSGVTTSSSMYGLLMQTGLCFRGLT